MTKNKCQIDMNFGTFTQKDIPLLLSSREKAQKVLSVVGIMVHQIPKVKKMDISKLMKKYALTNEEAKGIKLCATIYSFSDGMITLLSQMKPDKILMCDNQIRIYKGSQIF